MANSKRGKSAATVQPSSRTTKSLPKRQKPKTPLWQHATGQWAKFIKGKVYYFGTDYEKALDEYLRVREYLERRETPPPKDDPRNTLKPVCDAFLTHKQDRMRRGELTNRSLQDYWSTCQRFCDYIGKGRAVEDIRPADLLAYRQSLPEKWGPHAIGNEVNRVRVMLRWAFENGLIEKPIRFGEFKRPAKHVMRKQKADQGDASLSAWEIRRCINGSSPTLRAMILLGVNCGLGPADLGRLEHRHLDLEQGWLDFPRPKTGIVRRARLWPETIRTLKWALRERPRAKEETDEQLVFITKHGRPWSTGEKADTALAHEFRKLKSAVGKISDVGFYGLRRAFRTAADAARDPVAIDLVMGHADHTMGGQYRQSIEDKRLTRVAKVVRSWLWGAK